MEQEFHGTNAKSKMEKYKENCCAATNKNPVQHKSASVVYDVKANEIFNTVNE